MLASPTHYHIFFFTNIIIIIIVIIIINCHKNQAELVYHYRYESMK
jgi:hypothetical protein